MVLLFQYWIALHGYIIESETTHEANQTFP